MDHVVLIFAFIVNLNSELQSIERNVEYRCVVYADDITLFFKVSTPLERDELAYVESSREEPWAILTDLVQLLDLQKLLRSFSMAL